MVGETVVVSAVGVCGALVYSSWINYSWLSFSSKRERFYVGTVVIVETGVMRGMQLLVESNASAVKTVETGLVYVLVCNKMKINKTRHDYLHTLNMKLQEKRTVF